MFSDKKSNRDISSHLTPHVPRTASQTTDSARPSTSSTITRTTVTRKIVRPASAKPSKAVVSQGQIIRAPKNDSSLYFQTTDVGGNGTVNLKTSSSSRDIHGFKKRSGSVVKEQKKFKMGSYERRRTDPGRYMVQAREDALRRRHKLIARQGNLLEKEHLYDCQLANKLQTNRALDENRKLKSQLHLAQHKLRMKDNLLQESLNCTFVAVPSFESSKGPNMQLIFKLRKKVMELRDLVALQEVEIINM